MEKLKRLAGSMWGKMAAIVFIVLIAFGIRTILDQKQETGIERQTKAVKREIPYAEQAEEDNTILQVFRKQFPEAEVLLACEEDVTDDGCKDLVVIYRRQGLTRTVVVVDSGDGKQYSFSEPVPAPVENQKIQFRNIDKEAEIEFIITGEKKGTVGYAIYRMIDGQPADLFGEGMEDCC